MTDDIEPQDQADREPAELGRLLRRASQVAMRIYRARLAELDLTHRQAAAIRALAQSPGQTLSGLAESLHADPPTASALVDRLLAADLVRRETDPADRRRAMLYPTDKALELGEALREAVRDSEASIRSVLGPEDSPELARLLNRLIEGLAGAGHLDAPLWRRQRD
jgi:DNA-binding MarR family transcriptional regulator